MAQKEKEAEQQRKRIQELEVTQQKMEAALDAEIQARMEEEKARLEQERLRQEEEEKLKQLQLLQQEQDAKLLRAEKEKPSTEPQQRPSASALDAASQELQTLRETRERSSQHPGGKEKHSAKDREQKPRREKEKIDSCVQEAKEKLRNASRYVKHWNVRLNRLMTPITPGDRFEYRQSTKHNKDNSDGAFSSREFVTRCKTSVTQESHDSDSQSSEEEADLQEQLKAVKLSDSDQTRVQQVNQGH
ncbi:hypothetical protein AGOR_G00181600 [Albula goreensis]|uniref:Uncharacterized protein n=1 Tax=Albula goreensis TaxID=1534307 RepID=A0A8T3CSE8_9TELE|nr:hypothetical protein AGOR_G00181600 [Albula goreensis]